MQPLVLVTVHTPQVAWVLTQLVEARVVDYMLSWRWAIEPRVNPSVRGLIVEAAI